MPVGKKKRSDFDEGESRPCALNDWLKLIFAVVNLLYCVFGIALLGLTIYNQEEWSSLEGGSLERIMNLLITLGAAILFFVIIGCLGMSHQTVREGTWRGRRLLCIFELGVIAMLYLQFIVVIYTMNAAAGLEIVLQELKDGETDVPYLEVEEAISKAFDDYYFSTYDGSQNDRFWTLVDAKCPSSMRSTSCNEYSYASSCPDQTSCDAGGDDDYTACPYEMCRKQAGGTVYTIIEPLAEYGLFLLCFEIVVIVLTCLLICFNPHDDEKDLLTKAVGFDATEEAEEPDVETGKGKGKKKKKKKKGKKAKVTEADF